MNYSEHSVDPTRAYTQSIESVWEKLRHRDKKECSTNRGRKFI